MTTIQLTESAFLINQVPFNFPLDIKNLINVIGECRHTKKKHNHIYTWDQAGLLAYSSNGTIVEGLLLVWDYGNYDFTPAQSFNGAFTLNGEDAIAYYKANKSKRVKLFKGDDGGAFIMDGVSAWFDVDDDNINAIEIKAYEAPAKVEVVTLPIPDAFQYWIPLWQEWIDAVHTIVPSNNKYYNLTHGITANDLQAAKQIKEFTIPDALIYFYAARNVEWDPVTAPFCFSVNGWKYDLLPFDRIHAGWGDVDDLMMEEDCEPDNVQDFSDKVKANDYANPKWIPFAEGRNGDWLLFDADPSDKGTYGQIIELQNESWARQIVANSLQELVRNEISLIKNGNTVQYDFIASK